MRRLLLAWIPMLAACGEDVAAPAPPLPPPAAAPAPPPAELEPWESEPDPVRRRTLKEEAWFRAYPGLEGKEIRFHDLRPFLVAEVLPPGATADSPGAGPVLERTLAGVHGAVRAFVKEMAGIDAPRIEDLGDVRLRWILLPDRKEFDRWHAYLQIANPGGIYHRRGREDLVLGWSDGLTEEQAAWVASLQVLARWRFHFLQVADDEDSRARGVPPEPVTAEDGRLRTALAWFDRGLASWFSSGKVVPGPDPTWQPGLPVPKDYELLRESRALGRFWPLENMLLADSGQIRSRAGQMVGGNAMDNMVALHDLQSRLLIDVLLEPGGRWRAGFVELLRNELHGRTGKVYLFESFGLPKRAEAPEVLAWMAELEKACLARLDASAPPK